MYTNSVYTWDYGDGPEPYRANEYGPYTHYIDNTDPAATDSANPYGSPAQPRRTWVYPLPAGSAVQVHGGPYSFQNADGAKMAVGGDGTQALPKWHDGVLYWLTDGGLLVTTDKGATWKRAGEIRDGRYGPFFGKDARHLFVLTGAGIVASTDGGASWSQPVALPRELKGVSPLTWIEYDPRNDILYTMKMTSELYRMIRGR